jgi:IS5 family transposase
MILFHKFYNENVGRKALSIKLMIGLLLLKYIYNLSDEEAVFQWKESVYFHSFAGQLVYVDEFP